MTLGNPSKGTRIAALIFVCPYVQILRFSMTSKRSLVFDVGLNQGEDTNFYLRKGYTVVAFEANPDLVKLCKRRFESEIANQQLHIIEGAITPELGEGSTITFFKNDNLPVWGTVNPEWNKRNQAIGTGGATIEVNRIDIRKWLERFGIPHYIKIDIEGADTSVLHALREFDHRPTFLSIESNKVDLNEIENELKLLLSLGYEKFRPIQQANIPYTRIDTKDIHGKPFSFVFENHASGPFGEDLSQAWLSAEACFDAYIEIFKLYRIFGDQSLFRRIPGGLALRKALGIVWGRPLPGWYDTHAALPGAASE
jgi:FkbM family methyltransferase